MLTVAMLCANLARMCGIAGIISPDQANEEAVAAMLARMVHRGPDEGGVWKDRGCVLGHRRLRILDLSPTGSQPMIGCEGRVVVVFNGEIFNFRELRSELEAKGRRFLGSSDTEVLVHGYLEWGEALVPKLLGMFAFAIWDRDLNKLVLARDRYGKKPLFYVEEAGGLRFASEFDALLAAENHRLEISHEGFASYLRYGYVPGARTIAERVRRLEAGHVLTWENGRLQNRSFVKVPSYGERPMSDREFLEHLDSTLQAAVEARLISDVPLGCFLSGGIDSSLVVAYARKIHGPGLKTFTVSFPGTKRDEASFAKVVAGKLGTDHHQIDLHASDMESQYVETLRKCPEPLGDDSFLPTYFISRATRKYVTVAISGDGGDELFGGYPKYQQIRSAGRFHPLFRFFPGWLLDWLPDKYAKAADLFRISDECARALWLSSLWKEEELATVLLAPASAVAGRNFFRAEWEKHAGECLQEQFSMTDIATYLEGSILMKVDRASMAASLEVRAPLLDERILDLTVSTGIRNGHLGHRKAALRDLLSRHLPLELFAGPKRGFGLPIDEWFRGSLRGVLEDYTSEKRLRSGGLVDPRRIAGIRNQHLTGQRNYGRKLHALVAWEIWREQAGL